MGRGVLAKSEAEGESVSVCEAARADHLPKKLSPGLSHSHARGGRVSDGRRHGWRQRARRQTDDGHMASENLLRSAALSSLQELLLLKQRVKAFLALCARVARFFFSASKTPPPQRQTSRRSFSASPSPSSRDAFVPALVKWKEETDFSRSALLLWLRICRELDARLAPLVEREKEAEKLRRELRLAENQVQHTEVRFLSSLPFAQ